MSAVIVPQRRDGNGGSALQWARDNLFSSPFNTLLTLVCALFLVWALPPAIDWLFINAVWGRQPVEACEAVRGKGACWAVVSEKFRFMMFGTYPYEEQWRPAIVIVILVSLLVVSGFKRFWNRKLFVFWTAGIALSYWLMAGGLGLPPVRTGQWGGLPVTLILAIFGIAFAFPLGILLALGRRSQPADHPVAVGDLHRGGARRAADHGAVHGERDAGAVPAGRLADRPAVARAGGDHPVRRRLPGRGGSRRHAGGAQGAVRGSRGAGPVLLEDRCGW